VVPLNTRRRLPIALALAAVLAATACSPHAELVEGGTIPGTTGTAPGSTRPAQPLAWEPCSRGLQCATLAVPVDHDRPDGPTLDLRLARRPAVDGADRIGSVVVNPGGPGASGIEFVGAGGPGTGVLDRFDVVTWDPRGVGESHGLRCDGAAPPYRGLDWGPDDTGETAALDAGAEAVADACRAAAGDALDHLGTDDTARDLDAIRAALGEERLTYLGLSYGTAIGLRYAARFPDRVRAMILDGVVDPREDLGTWLAGQTAALEKQFAAGPAAVQARYDRVAAAVERAPLPSAGGPVGPTELGVAAIAATYSPGGDQQLAAALAAAEQGRGDGLRALADGYWSGGEYGAYVAVSCTDGAHREGGGDFDEEVVRRLTALSPRFGATVANELRPCAFWPDVPRTLPPLDAAGAPPILVLGTTGDVATPYETAQRIAGTLDSGVLLTAEGTGHTSFGRNRCVEDHLQAYLESLTVPPTGARCG
jgi:pimeloyl-ACP methyl ester carboxylesterase